MSFGDRLKELRCEKGLTQDELGYMFNVTKSCICCYENNSREPSIKMLIELSSYFRVSIDYLLGVEEVKKTKKLTKIDLKIMNKIKKNPIVYKAMVNDVDGFFQNLNYLQ